MPRMIRRDKTKNEMPPAYKPRTRANELETPDLPKKKRDFSDTIEDGEIQIEKVERQTSVRMASWTKRLDSDGEPLPTMIGKNLADKEFVSPRSEFVTALNQPSYYSLALTWGLQEETLGRWAREQNWLAQRTKYWEKINQRMWEQSETDLAQMRGIALQRGITRFQTMSDTVDAYVRRGTKSITQADGSSREEALDALDLLRLSKVQSESIKGELVCLGLNFRLADETSDKGDNQDRPASSMVFVVPMTEDERSKMIGQEVQTYQLTEGKKEEYEGEIVE